MALLLLLRPVLLLSLLLSAPILRSQAASGSIAEEEDFSEELLLRPLPDRKVLAHFHFRSRAPHTSSNGLHHHLFPKAISQLLRLKGNSQKKVKAAAPASSGKRPHLEVETVGDAPRPKKLVKKLAKKGEQEIHVISGQTTGATIPSVSLLPLVVEASIAIQLDPSIEPAINSAVEQLATSAPVVAYAKPNSVAITLEEATPSAKKNSLPIPKKTTAIIMEEKDNKSEGPQLVRRSQPAKKTTLNPQLVVETASQVEPPSVEANPDPARALLVELEPTAVTSVHPQDQNISIHPQEVTSNFVPDYSFHRKFYALKGVIYISWPPQWPSNVDKLH
ncbi:uncharacterized protein LOC103948684 [Pyrus x bretschneideri]|uniref:uncharacterized protein LOC103948684 n=1 Tax=Pyrus x bretschneideri TaxID=225117 RepID=UPI00202FD303|nr:uncharacterized protein LOC103948684 [Pyrus x bretschneideri]